VRPMRAHRRKIDVTMYASRNGLVVSRRRRELIVHLERV
jgi:hypothetical protein